MNARLYDPTLARMLAPDNVLGDPTNTQSYNKYSYVINNPLKYTDPSGNNWVEGVVKLAVHIGISWGSKALVGGGGGVNVSYFGTSGGSFGAILTSNMLNPAFIAANVVSGTSSSLMQANAANQAKSASESMSTPKPKPVAKTAERMLTFNIYRQDSYLEFYYKTGLHAFWPWNQTDDSPIWHQYCNSFNAKPVAVIQVPVVVNFQTGKVDHNGVQITKMRKSGFGKPIVNIVQTTSGNEFSFDLDGTSSGTTTLGGGGAAGPVEGAFGHENSISTGGAATIKVSYRFNKTGFGTQTGTVNVGNTLDGINDDDYNYKVEIDDSAFIRSPTIIIP